MTTVSADRLFEEVQELRRTVEGLRRLIGRRRVSLAPVQLRPFLGQSVTIVATVTDVFTGEPVIDAPVTFMSTWGQLSGADGYTVRQGGAITLRTDADGVIRIVLQAQTSEPLLHEQQDVLDAMLSQLDPEAETPDKLREALDALAREYRWEANYPFRQAVDIYFRDFRAGITDTINYHDHLTAWSHFDATVIAYAREDDAGDLDTQVGATAVLDLRFKNWLAPWYDAYAALSRADAPLSHAFDNLRKTTNQAAPLLEGVYAETKQFVDHQRGLVGEYVANKVAENAVREFLSTGLQDLDLDERLAAAPALEVATSAIAKGSIAVVATVGQTQKNLRTELGGKTSDPRITDLVNRLGVVESTLDRKLEIAAFEDFRGSVTTSLATKLNSITFNSFRNQLETTLATKADRTEVRDLQTAIDGLRNNSLTRDEFVTFREQTNSTLAAKTDLTTFNTFRDQTRVDLQNKVDRTRFDSFSNTITNDVGTLRESTRQFGSRIATLEDRVRIRPNP
jgi:hypothetical protein